MFESLLASVLNRVLGDYVDNLEQSQLNVGIWKGSLLLIFSGNVVLNKLKLKKTALDRLQLPIKVVDGTLGELLMQIPWKNLKSEPVKIKIKDLMLVSESSSFGLSQV